MRARPAWRPTTCWCTARCRPQFVDLLAGKIKEFYGDDPAQSPDFCRIASERHTARFQQLLEGQKIHTGGRVDVRESLRRAHHRARSGARLGPDDGGDLRAGAAVITVDEMHHAIKHVADRPSRWRSTCSRRARRSRKRCSGG
jgi:hypothetical protein